MFDRKAWLRTAVRWRWPAWRGRGARHGGRAGAGADAGQGRLRLREPDRGRRLDVSSTTRAARRWKRRSAGKVTTKYVENVAEGADAERVIRELAQSGSTIIFTTSFGYMNSDGEGGEAVPEGQLHARDRLQDRPELRHLQRALLRRPLPHRRDRRQDDQVQHPGLRRRVPDPRGAAGDQRVHARRAQRQSEGRGARDLGELVVRPGQGARGGATR